MSELSYLEKLLDGAEVKWLPVTKIFNIKNGYTPSKSNSGYWTNGEIPWFRMDDIRENGQILDNSFQHISSSAVKGGKLFPANSILMSTSATIGEFALISVPHLANQRFTCLTPNETYINKFNIKFLFYYCFILSDWCKKNTTISSFASVDMDGFKKFPVPIPCPNNSEKSLAIQSEIVRILDKFTALTAELTAELTARKKQYNYYRDQLLSFEEGECEWKTLEEVADVYDSLHQTPQYSENGFSMVRVTDIKNGCVDLSKTLKVSDEVFSVFTKKYSPQKNDLVMSRVGSYGNLGIIPLDNAVCMGQNTVVIHPKINSSYLFYILTSKIAQNFIEKNVGGGSQKTLSLKSIKAIPIPFISESEQHRIASILGTFESLTNSITEGLPREIELRQQQYEYYRDLLFNFPKPESVTK
ncbi:MAG: restriction endonuclease subunit S [Providencia heimbachae]|nr:restriction endonuclease subunit S [Providencia heimbachae]